MTRHSAPATVPATVPADLGVALTACPTPDAVAQRVSELGAALAGATVGAVFLRRWRDDGSDRYVPAGVAGATFDDFPPLPSINPARLDPENPFFSAFCRPDVSLVPDVEAHPKFRGLPEPHPPLRSFLAVPLLDAAGTSWGVFEAGHPKPDRFAADTAERVVVLAAHAASRLAAQHSGSPGGHSP